TVAGLDTERGERTPAARALLFELAQRDLAVPVVDRDVVRIAARVLGEVIYNAALRRHGVSGWIFVNSTRRRSALASWRSSSAPISAPPAPPPRLKRTSARSGARSTPAT